MQLTLYQVDAFASQLFTGNPAAVCLLTQWYDDSFLQAIAAENNLSETAFAVKNGPRYQLRWFTPTREVDLCGHATLACAYVLFNEMNIEAAAVEFDTRSGVLCVTRDNECLDLRLPLQALEPAELPEVLRLEFGNKIIDYYQGDDCVVLLQHENDVIEACPNLERLSSLPARGVSISAAASNFDFVSRFFAPQSGIDEDPVTGSSFSYLAPIWGHRMNKTRLHAKQVSSRGGEVYCIVETQSIRVQGQCVMYLKGTLDLPDAIVR